MKRPQTANCQVRPKKNNFAAKLTSCPLDNDNLPIVSELEHKIGRCFCHHCTCEKHVCIGLKYKPVAKNTYTSLYKSEFQSKSQEKDQPFLPKEYKSFLKTSAQPTSLTTSQSDFSKKELGKSEICRPSEGKSTLKFSGRSSYDREFCDWKQEAINSSRNHLPYRGYMVKPWQMESMYKESYKAHGSIGALLRTSSSQFGVKSLVNPGNYNSYETTAKNAFGKTGTLGSSTPDLGKIKNIKTRDQVVASKNHYSTAYSTDFTPKAIQFSLTRLR